LKEIKRERLINERERGREEVKKVAEKVRVRESVMKRKRLFEKVKKLERKG
jgi:hypothetical protein